MLLYLTDVLRPSCSWSEILAAIAVVATPCGQSTGWPWTTCIHGTRSRSSPPAAPPSLPPRTTTSQSSQRTQSNHQYQETNPEPFGDIKPKPGSFFSAANTTSRALSCRPGSQRGTRFETPASLSPPATSSSVSLPPLTTQSSETLGFKESEYHSTRTLSNIHLNAPFTRPRQQHSDVDQRSKARQSESEDYNRPNTVKERKEEWGGEG